MDLNTLRQSMPELSGLDDESAVDVIQQAYYPDISRAEVASRLGVKMSVQAVARPGRTMGDFVKDSGISVLKGAISVPEGAVGIADMATGGRAGKLAEEIGFRPKDAKAFLDAQYSDAQKAANAEVANAEGFVDTIGAALSNPSTIVQSAIESAPSMLGGAAIGRGLLAVAPKIGPVVAAAAGEGAVSAGQTAEQIRQQTDDGLLTPKQSAAAGAAGLGTSLLGLLGGTIAKRLGIADVDTMLAAGSRDAGVRKGIVRAALEGAAAEGLLEELPQSVQEQVWQNYATGKPLDDGVDQAAVMGALTGGLMGGGAGVVARPGDPIRQQKVPERGPLSRAANSGIEAEAQKADAGLPTAGPLAEDALSRLDAMAQGDLGAQKDWTGRGSPEVATGSSGARAAGAPGGPVDASATVADEPFLDRILTLRAGLSDQNNRQRVRDTFGDRALNDLTYYASIADRSDLPEKTRDNLLAVAEQIFSRSQAQPIAQPAAIGSEPFAAPDALEAPAIQPRIGVDTRPTGRFRADAAGNVRPETRADDINVRQAQQQAADAAAQAESLGRGVPYGKSRAQPGKPPALTYDTRPTGRMVAGPGGVQVETQAQRINAENARKVRPGDVTNPEGNPFRNRPAAVRVQRQKGGDIVEVDGGWVVRQPETVVEPKTEPFHPDTGTLGIPRTEMPQVKSEHHGALTNFMNARGIDHATMLVDPDKLKPTQAEFSPEKVEAAKESTGGRSVIVSSDGHVVDGHHQWLAAKEEGKPLKAIVLDAPIEQAMEAARAFPSSQTANDQDQPQRSEGTPADAGQASAPQDDAPGADDERAAGEVPAEQPGGAAAEAGGVTLSPRQRKLRENRAAREAEKTGNVAGNEKDDTAKQARQFAHDLAKSRPDDEYNQVRADASKAIREKFGEGVHEQLTEGNFMSGDELGRALHDGRYAALREFAESMPVPVRESDIPMATAVAAYRNTSHSPEVRGASAVRDYVRSLVDAWKRGSAGAKGDPAAMDRVTEVFKVVVDGYRIRTLQALRSHANVASAMITGPARFPTAANRKRSQAADNKAQEADEFLKKGISRMLKAAKAPVDNSPSSELDRVRANLAEREKAQDQMKAANAALRKGDDEALRALGFSDERIAQLKKPDFAGRKGFPDYALKNNNAEIRRLRDRLASAESRVTEAAAGPKERTYAGVRIEENAQDDRLRLFFDGKPSDAVREDLKANAFKWSPRAGAWQRQLTNNARAAAKQVLDKHFPDSGEKLSVADGPSVPEILAELAQFDEMFLHPTSKAKSLAGVFNEIDPAIELVGDATREDERDESGADKRTMLRAAGKDIYVYEKGDQVWIDVSRLEQGQGGDAIYAAVANYAFNNGKEFVGDPAGLSESAIIRRTYHMLGSALRFGTTDHFQPAPEQLKGLPEKGIPPLSWKGNDAQRIQALADTFTSTLYARYPGLREFSYDFDRHTLVDGQGNPVARDGILRRVNPGRSEAPGLGRRAAAAGIFIDGLARAQGGRRSSLLAEILRQPAQLVGANAPLFSAADGKASTQTQHESASEAQQQFADKLRQRLNDAGADVRVLRAVSPGGGSEAGIRRTAQAAATAAKRLFGHEVVFVDFGDHAPLFNGAMSDAIPGVIFIRADANKPFMSILGHELLHHLRRELPGIYQTLDNRLRTVIKNKEQFASQLEARNAKHGRGLPHNWLEELNADIVGDNFMDPEFWQAMATDQPGMFRRVVRAILKWLDDIAAKLTKDETRPFGTDKYLKDIAAARAAVADAMRKFSGTQVGAMTTHEDGINLSVADKAQTDTPAFKRWFGDSKVVDADGKPLVVYHGTSKDITVFDPEVGSTPGSWFAVDPDGAAAFGNQTMPVHLAISKPGTLADLAAARRAAAKRFDPSEQAREFNAAALDELQKAGFDGIKADNFAGAGGDSVWMAVRPEQIKSAIGNRGTFDPASSDIRLSIADTLGSIDQQKVRDALSDFLGSAGARVSWWERTIGTQYAKAQKHPEFKRVFDHVQSYLEDTSTLANEAADNAPGILPKLDTWKDLKGSGLSSANAQAIAAPIFEGTLTEKKVFGDAELRDQYKLTDEQVGLYRQFLDTVNASLDQVVAADVLRLLGDAPPAFKAVALRNRGILQRLINEYIDGEIAKVAPEDAGKWESLREDVNQRYERVAKLKAEGYAPLMRFGQFLVNVRDKHTGESLFFGLYESRSAANRMRRQLAADPEFKDAEIQQGVLSQEQYKLFAGVPIESLEMFADALGAEKDEVFQQYLRLVKNNRSAMKRMIHRNGTAGFSQDVPRVLASFVTSNARLASGGMNMPGASDAARQIRAGDVKDEAIKLIDTVQNPKETAAAARGFLFMNFLGGSVASAVVNMTQPITMTAPYLSQWGGVAKAAARLLDAGRLAASGKIADEDLAASLHRAEAEGIVSPQEIHHLQGEAMGAWGTHPMVKKAAFVWGSLFSLAEQWNRRVTFIAAYKTAVAENLGNPYTFAEKAVIETQGLYNRGNAPNWARNPVGATVLTFKQFSIHYLEWLQRMWKSGPEGKKAVGVALAILFLAAGADGLPFADDIDDLVDTLAQALGYDFSSKRAKQKFVAETLGLGEDGANVFSRGLSSVPGVPIDVSMRMSMGNLLPATGFFLKSNNDRSRDVMEVAGAAGALVKQYADAGEKALAGDFKGAATTAMPMALQNVAKAVGMWESGEYKDGRGRRVMDADEMDGLMKFIGFQPASIAAESRAVSLEQRRVALVRNTESEIADQWAKGELEKDPEAVQAARDRLREWNETNPQSRIVITRAQIRRRLRDMRAGRNERFLKTAPKEIRRSVAEAIQ